MLIWDNDILRTLGCIYSAREAARPCHTTTSAVSCVKHVWFSFMVVIITLKSARLRAALPSLDDIPCRRALSLIDKMARLLVAR